VGIRDDGSQYGTVTPVLASEQGQYQSSYMTDIYSTAIEEQLLRLI